jgi:hypothetical protein
MTRERAVRNDGIKTVLTVCGYFQLLKNLPAIFSRSTWTPGPQARGGGLLKNTEQVRPSSVVPDHDQAFPGRIRGIHVHRNAPAESRSGDFKNYCHQLDQTGHDSNWRQC